MSGGAGDDVLNAGTGFDLLIGGSGNDTYLGVRMDEIVERADGGIDHVITSTEHHLAEHVEHLTLLGSE